METTEKIVEAYVRYVKHWATIPNVKCDGQREIDLIAVDPNSGHKYHIESGVSVSGSYSQLTARPYSLKKLRERQEAAGQRRTLDYFIHRKFKPPEVFRTLKKYGFKRGRYGRVVVTWGWTDEAKRQADRKGIELWDFRKIIKELASEFGATRAHFADDTIRTMQLYLRSGVHQDKSG